MNSHSLPDTKKYEAAFCNNIRHLRRIWRLTLQEMAQLCGTSAANIKRIESGHYPKRLCLPISIACCRSFGLSLQFFMHTEFSGIE